MILDKTIKLRLISTSIFIVVDILWINFMLSKYKKLVEGIQGFKLKFGKDNMIYAFISYLLLIFGLNYFVLSLIDINDIKNISIKKCLKYAFTFGIIVYGVYNFTAASIFTNWNIMLCIMDTLWGGFIYFISVYSLKYIYNFI